MAAILTDWEKQHIESIQLLLKEATEVVKYFEEKEKAIGDAESDLDSQDWLKFRHFVLDLYSVLDYAWYLLYCHFSNSGNVDFTRKGRMLGFPAKVAGVKCSAHPPQDQTSKFVNDCLKQISKDIFGEESDLYRIVSDYVLKAQPKIQVDTSGHGASTPDVTKGSNHESFLMLHFYRNCAAHKDLVRFAPREAYAEINQKTREIKLVTNREERDGYHYHKINRGYWIQLPEVSAHDQGEPRLLLDALHQMNRFVQRTCSTLLRAALLIPSAREILQKLVEDRGGKMTVTTSKAQDGKVYTAIATVVTAGKMPYKEEFQSDSKTGAEENACVHLFTKLRQSNEIPPSLISAHVPFLPSPKKVKNLPQKNKRMVLNEYKQQLELDSLKVDLVPKVDKHPSEEQVFIASLEFVVSTEDGRKVIKLESGECTAIGKDKSQTKAAQNILEDLIRLGLVTE